MDSKIEARLREVLDKRGYSLTSQSPDLVVLQLGSECGGQFVRRDGNATLRWR